MLEIGGQWVSPDQDALLETLDELGLETYSRYRDGEYVYIGASRRACAASPAISSRSRRRPRRRDPTSSRRSTHSSPRSIRTQPWAHPNAEELDRSPSSTGCAEQTDDEEARDNIGLFIAGAMLTKPAHAFSALQALLMAASAGAFSHLVDADFILDKRVIGGLQQVPLLPRRAARRRRAASARRCARSTGTRTGRRDGPVSSP